MMFWENKGGKSMNREIEIERLERENKRLRDTIRQLNQTLNRVIEKCVMQERIEERKQ
jgi:hypothetical protein